VIARSAVADGYDISCVIKGGWHLAGGHGAIEPAQALADMAAFVEAGITTFDCADIYTGVEALIGRFRQAYPSLAAAVQVHTKFVPDLSRLATLTRAEIEAGIDRSLSRLGAERLDLVQFHWWDYDIPGFVETALELDRLRRKGKIRNLGLTNFDVAHAAELIEAGVPVATHQIQYSLIDDRARHGMVAFCAANAIKLLCYGSVAGGFLSERWLGAAEPAGALANRSLVKYKLIIDDFGGWPLFQALLRVLKRVADAHGADIATVAARVILDREQVAAVIVGATNTAHLAANTRIADIRLSDAERAEIQAVADRRQGPQGDVYALERDRAGRHGRIMQYEANGDPAPGRSR
jgi:aryl-alcohol dehydrogenase-like predicted oxidoreductase